MIIHSIQENSPASKAGFLPGFEIVTIGKHSSRVLSIDQIERLLKISDKITFQYLSWPATLL